MTHVIDLSPHRELHLGVYKDGSLWAEVFDARWPEEDGPRTHIDARNVKTLVNTLRDLGIELPEETRTALEVEATRHHLELFAKATRPETFRGKRNVSDRRAA